MTQSTFLVSWKEIAQYLGKGVRTVQRWEQERGLPVRRPESAASKSVVLVETEELDRWVRHTFRRGKALDPRMDWELLEHSKRLIAMASIVRQEHSRLLEESRQIRLELENSPLPFPRRPVKVGSTIGSSQNLTQQQPSVDFQ